HTCTSSPSAGTPAAGFGNGIGWAGIMSHAWCRPRRRQGPRGAARVYNGQGGGGAMIPGWLLMMVSVAYVAALFAIAYFGDRHPLYPARAWLRPIVYSLALAVYCSSWTFYGAVGSAARSGLSYLPIYLGPILLFVFGFGLLERLVVVAKERNEIGRAHV